MPSRSISSRALRCSGVELKTDSFFFAKPSRPSTAQYPPPGAPPARPPYPPCGLRGGVRPFLAELGRALRVVVLLLFGSGGPFALVAQGAAGFLDVACDPAQ